MDVDGGISLLKYAASKGYVRASYALGLALRDSMPAEASHYMKNAADEGYIPALQELLPARKMKAKYGEPKADELRLHLDPLCLNRLLSRFYVQSAELRELSTSHCWNPLCGRWAFKATVNGRGERNRHSLGFSFRSPHSATPTNDSATHRTRSTHTSHGSSESLRIMESAERISSTPVTTEKKGSSNKLLGGGNNKVDVRVSRMKMCSRCCRAKYCSKLCQVYDWRSGRHKMECQFL